MPVLELNFEAFCESCGKGMCANVYENKKLVKIDIVPCEYCLDGAREEMKREMEQKNEH